MSRSADAAVGMMDAAYFTGRKELLEFFNELLDLQLTKIEQTATGAVACQLTEIIFPGSIPMSKVNWEARSDYEFVQNYKLLQNAFTKHHVQRYVDVTKLIRAKYQDNLEFCQWLKAFYDQSGVFREDYDPMAVRARGKGGKRYQYNRKSGAGGARPAAGRARPAAARPTGAAARKTAPAKPAAAASKPAVVSDPPSPKGIRESRPLRERHNGKPVEGSAEVDAALKKENEELQAKNTELEAVNGELEANVGTLEEAVLEIEKERDFYFGKLRHVEVLLQIFQETEGADTTKAVDDIFKILYASAEDNLTVNDDGEVVAGDDIASNESLDEVLDNV